MTRAFLWLLAGGAAYYLTARLGICSLSGSSSGIPILWLPVGIGFVMCLYHGWRAVPFIFVASLVVTYPDSGPTYAGDSPAFRLLRSILSAGAATLVPWLAAVVMKRVLPGGLTRVRHLLRFCLLVCIVPIAVPALFVVANLAAAGYIPADEAFIRFRQFILGGTLGILLVYPLAVVWKQDAGQAFQWQRCTAFMTAGTLLVYVGTFLAPGLLFALVPLLLYQVFFTPARSATLNMFVIITLTAAALVYPDGPYSVLWSGQALVVPSAFLMATVVTLLGALLAHWEIQEERMNHAKWRFEAEHDTLTGLKNRQVFTPMLEAEFKRTHRTNIPYVVAIADIDRFKTINDSLGHKVGDEVLAAVATHLDSELREIDVVARIGGEEFGILFPETTLEQAVAALDRARASLRQVTVSGDAEPVPVTFSAGLSAYRESDPDPERAMQRADELLYRAKQQGRDRVVGE